jgi:hypothetical protein
LECPSRIAAGFELSCPQTDLISVSLSGLCAGDAGSAGYSYSGGGSFIDVWSAGPGDCHVVLTFDTGFTYSADVTFVSQPAEFGPCYVCNGSIYPTQQTFVVNNPSTTCVDAGPDVHVSDAGVDGLTDALSEAASGAELDVGTTD